MKSEFTERTKYNPTDEEYAEIEESYYEFDGNKDEFCRAWLKDQKSGAWAKEFKLRHTIRSMATEILMHEQKEAEHAQEINELCIAHESILQKQREQIEELSTKLAQAQHETEMALIEGKKEVHIIFKDGAREDGLTEETAPISHFQYNDNNGFQFITVTQPSGWIDSYKLDSIELIEVH